VEVDDRATRFVVLRLDVVAPVDDQQEAAEIDPESDAGLVKDGWASLTSILGVREDHSSAGTEVLAKALAEVHPADA